MKNMFKKSATFLFLILLLTGCGSSAPTQDNSLNNKQSISWKTYSNSEMGFSIKVPEKVLSNYMDENSLVDLNIFENNGNVYFTTHSLEDTLKNNSWEYKISGTTINDESEIVPFLESVYGVKGCDDVQYYKDETSGFFNVGVFAKDRSLSPDYPLSCFIAGKIGTIYDKNTGKLITSQIVEPFFFEPGKSVGEESLASLKFEPLAPITPKAEDTNTPAPAVTQEVKDTNVPAPAKETVNPTTEKTFTLTDISSHNTENDCWMAIDGKVYDVTAYIQMHNPAIIDGCGADATSLFGSVGKHSSPQIQALLGQYLIGILK